MKVLSGFFIMRKRLKKKKGTHLCMCKYYKKGAGLRWTAKEYERLKEWEKEKRTYV